MQVLVASSLLVCEFRGVERSATNLDPTSRPRSWQRSMTTLTDKRREVEHLLHGLRAAVDGPGLTADCHAHKHHVPFPISKEGTERHSCSRCSQQSSMAHQQLPERRGGSAASLDHYPATSALTFLHTPADE